MRRPSMKAVAVLAVATCALSWSTGATSDRIEPAGTAPENAPAAATSPSAFALPWYSVNAGGVMGSSSTSYKMSQSVGQSVTGKAASSSYTLGIGFWYGVGAEAGCPITRTGDVNVSGTITSADIIGLVNYVFKGGAQPQPCVASGDVNCSGAVTSADIISLVNYVFKAGPSPCDACTSPLAAGC